MTLLPLTRAPSVSEESWHHGNGRRAPVRVMSRHDLALASKRVVARSMLHRPATVARSFVLERLIMRQRRDPDPDTNYCISPYKTATTFIANLFAGARTCHEPLHYLTLKNIDDARFLAHRKRYLRLELESSGFLSLAAESVLGWCVGRKALFIIRDPVDWIGSVVDHFAVVDREISYNYIEDLFFARIAAAGASRFHTLDDHGKSRVAESLLRFWIRTYRGAVISDRCFVVRLEELGDKVDLIEHHFGMKATDRAARGLRNGRRGKLDLRGLVDLDKYAQDIAALGY
jgi:hypothetical protein